MAHTHVLEMNVKTLMSPFLYFFFWLMGSIQDTKNLTTNKPERQRIRRHCVSVLVCVGCEELKSPGFRFYIFLLKQKKRRTHTREESNLSYFIFHLFHGVCVCLPGHEYCLYGSIGRRIFLCSC